MLRRRIFSSAMASVMALSSIAVVAQAEETKAFKEKADLDKLINETLGDYWRENTLVTYADSYVDAMNSVLDTAEAILNNANSTAKDFTVAYYMVKGAEAHLHHYTLADLAKLVEQDRPLREDDNILNEELMDNRYDPDLKQAFDDAWDEALSVVEYESIDPNEIDNAYVDLDNADNLEELPTVTKGDYRAAIKAVEDIIANASKYDRWRRGSMANCWAFNSNLDPDTGFGWAFSRQTISYGALVDTMLSTLDKINEKYEYIDNIKNLVKTSDETLVAMCNWAEYIGQNFKEWKPDNVNRGTKTNITALLKEYHNQMVYDFEKAASEDAISLITSADADLLVVVDGEELEADVATGDDAWDVTIGYTKLLDGSNLKCYCSRDSWAGHDHDKIIETHLYIKPSDTIYIPLDEETGYINLGGTVYYGEEPDDYTSAKYQRVGKNLKFDLAKLIPVQLDSVLNYTFETEHLGSIAMTPDEVAGYFEGFEDHQGFALYNPDALSYYDVDDDNATDLKVYGEQDYGVDFATAYENAIAYLNGEYDIDENETNNLVTDLERSIHNLDDSGVVGQKNGAPADITGSSKEWTLVYRYLKYALEDRYLAVAPGDAAACKHTRADVQNLIDQAYAVADRVGETSIFAASHDHMMLVRQAAIDWKRTSLTDRYYKEYTTEYTFDDYTEMVGTEPTAKYLDSDDVYHKLEAAINNVLEEEAALSITFGEIYDSIWQTAEKIDNGTLNSSVELITAMQDTAFRLALVEQEIVYNEGAGCIVPYADNAAFDDEWNVLRNNRLITDTDEEEDKATYIDTLAGTIHATPVHANPTHYALNGEYSELKAAIKKNEPQKEVLLGDADLNGTPNEITDAIAALQMYVDGKVVAEADMDEDKDVDVDDAKTILNNYVNK